MDSHGHVEPTPESLSLCDECFGLTSTVANLHQMSKQTGLRFQRTLGYLEEKGTVCKMCAWILDVSDSSLWEYPGHSLDIGIRSLTSGGEIVRGTGLDFHDIAIDTFGISPPGTNERRSWVSFPIVAYAGDPAAKYICKRPSISDPKSKESLELVSHWAKYCEESHTLCQPPAAELPTRVIDVGISGDVRLFHAKGQKSKYACLSYCWGVAKQAAMLHKENLEALSANITFDTLPPTLQDAIFVTRSLGLRYLWVDALCIMQDDSTDAGDELRSMAKIYGNAAITISASCAASVNEGFLFTRPDCVADNNQLSVALPYRCPDGSLGQINSVSSYTYKTFEEPITKRAWTLQEQLLSPRLVIYGKETIMWECQTGQWNIQDLDIHKSTKSVERQEPLVRLHNAFFDPNLKKSLSKEPLSSNVRKDWQSLVEHYMRRKLTYAPDKLNAISALKDAFKDAFPTHEYFCGLWMNEKLPGRDMLHQLLWYVPIPLSQIRYTDPAVAPSWSWASIADAVEWRNDTTWSKVSTARKKAMHLSESAADIYWGIYHPWHEEENAERALADVTDWLPTNISINYPLVGMTMLGELTITGPLKAAMLEITHSEHISRRNASVRATPEVGRRVPGEELNVYLDTNTEHLSGSTFDCWLLRLVEGHGLVIMEAGRTVTGEQAFERVGLYREECNMDEPPWVRPVEYWFVGTKDRTVVLV